MIKKITQKDLDDAIKYFNKNSNYKITRKELSFEGFELKEPIELIDKKYPLNQDKGWLSKSYKKDEWIKTIEDVEVRRFSHIISEFFKGSLTSVIQINEILCDGFGRCIFFHAIGKKVCTSVFSITA